MHLSGSISSYESYMEVNIYLQNTTMKHSLPHFTLCSSDKLSSSKACNMLNSYQVFQIIKLSLVKSKINIIIIQVWRSRGM